MSSGRASIDLNSTAGAKKEIDQIIIQYIYGTSKIVETTEKKKVRISIMIMNTDLVNNREGGE